MDAPTEDSWRALDAELNAHAERLRGTVGFWVEELHGQSRSTRLPDTRFPTASTIKTAILVAVLREVEAGRMDWMETLPVPPHERRELSPWAWFFPEGQPIDVDGWVNLMIGYSDNTATVVLRDRLGTERVNQILEELGFQHTRLLSGAPPEATDLSALRQRFGLGVTTPREMARLLKGIALGHFASRAASERMLRILAHQYWDNMIASAVPPTVLCASKSGFVAASRSDTAIVFGPIPHVVVLHTSDLEDRSWGPDNEAVRWIREASAIVWRHLAPSMPYEPPDGWERFLPRGGGFDQEV
ncbi:MAG: serine hydrolase [Fimbriimonadales bacterium]